MPYTALNPDTVRDFLAHRLLGVAAELAEFPDEHITNHADLLSGVRNAFETDVHVVVASKSADQAVAVRNNTTAHFVAWAFGEDRPASRKSMQHSRS